VKMWYKICSFRD